MKQKFKQKQKLFFVFTLFTLLLGGILKSNAQNSTSMSIKWTNGVGCEMYSEDPHKELFLEEIIDGKCIFACQYSSMTFTLFPYPDGGTTVWTVTGGTTTSVANNEITINWSGSGEAEIAFTITTESVLITKKLCVTIVEGPSASFNSTPFVENQPIFGCATQTIYFNDSSTVPIGSSAIGSYQWDFGDPNDNEIGVGPLVSHVYSSPGTYYVKLTVKNGCNCTSTTQTVVHIAQEGFDIICPSIACEKEIATYSLPQEALNACGGFNWSVVGGTIIGSDHAPTVNVIWDNVDAAGFGFVTFTPSQCSLPCVFPTTLRIPVIKSTGTIVGNNSICLGQQGKYKLPQWPTTDIQWQIEGNSGGQLGTIIQTDQRNEVIVTPAQAGTITLLAIYRNTLVHCGGSAKLVITVGQPEPFSGESLVCVGTFTTYSTLSTHSVNWTLKDSNGSVVDSSAAATNTYNYTFSTVGDFTLSVSGPNICANQVRNITVQPVLTAPIFDTPETIICPNVPYEFKILDPEPNSEYEWEIVNGNFIGNATGSEVNVTFLGDGSIKVRRIQLSPEGCSSPFTTTYVNTVALHATVSNQISVIATDMTACSNNYFNYYAINNTPGGGIFNEPDTTYEWSISPATGGSVTLGQGTANVEVLWNNVPSPQSFNLVLVIKKCTVIEVITKSVIVYPAATISISGPSTVCSGNDITFTLGSNGNIPADTVVTWSINNGLPYTTAAGVLTTTKNFNNGSLSNIGYTVTATVANLNGCTGTITAIKNFVVTPGPIANASITNGGYSFCEANAINTVLSASTSPFASVQWYKNNISNPISTNASINIATFGFGTYFFVATLNTCKTVSNSIAVIQNCPIGNCTIDPMPETGITGTNSCGTLLLTGTASGTPLTKRFSIVGPNVNITNVPSNFGINQYKLLDAKAGIYNVYYTIRYTSTTGGVCTISELEQVKVHYDADFKISTGCANNSTNESQFYNVTLTNYSGFLSTVTPASRQFKYERKPAVGGVWSTIGSGWSTNPNATITGLAPGNYLIRQTIRGSENGIALDECSKTSTFTIPSMNNLSISASIAPCFDSNVTFSVPFATNANIVSYLWTFETVGGNLVTNTNPLPGRVFNPEFAGTTVNVSVTVTNKFGCPKTLTTAVVIPVRCFSGSITSEPSDAIVCKPDPVLLSYTPGNLPIECGIALYRWKRDNVTVATTTTNSHPVTIPGTYTVEVVNSAGCTYTSPNYVTPLFKALPSLTLTGPSTLCEGDEAYLSVDTNAPNIEWNRNNVVVGTNADLILPNLPVGMHTVSVTVTSEDGCTKVQSQTFEVIPPAAQVSIGGPYLIDCPTYEVELTASANGVGTYNWSNGASTSSITVHEGGAYSVRFTNTGGCSTTAQVYVPKSPKAYMWVFPEGCYSKCKPELATLLGPTLPINAWDWLLNQQSVQDGTNSVPTPLNLQSSGTYNLQLNTGLCDFPSASMDLTTNENCPECPLKIIVRKITVNSGFPCSYNVLFSLVNNSGMIIPASLVSNNGSFIALPGTINVLQGGNDYNFTVIPVNGFTSGAVEVSFIGSILDHDESIDCSSVFDLHFPNCNNGQSRPAGVEDKTNANVTSLVTLYPNPANGTVQLQYDLGVANSTLELYELTGRLLTQQKLMNAKDTTVLNISTYGAGVYIVVVRDENNLLYQQKLIIK